MRLALPRRLEERDAALVRYESVRQPRQGAPSLREEETENRREGTHATYKNLRRSLRNRRDLDIMSADHYVSAGELRRVQMIFSAIETGAVRAAAEAGAAESYCLDA
jgi:hypothetical protein